MLQLQNISSPMDAQLFILMILLAVSNLVVVAQQTNSNVTLGTFLRPTSNLPWLSPSGLYAMGFFREGGPGYYKVGIFLAGIPERTIVWTANRDDPPVPDNFTLVFTSEGQLVLQSPQGDQTSIAAGLPLSQYASMLDSGNFAIFDTNGNILWQSFDHPTDCLLPTQPLLTGNQILSSMAEDNHATGIFRLKMQIDGNLIQYPINTPDTAPYSYFTSWTGGRGNNVSLRFNIDGHLYLIDTTGSNIRNITPGNLPTQSMTYIFRLDPDGLMRLYSYNLTQNSNWSVAWNSNSDKCVPKGLCGLNGYCVLVGNDAECRCIPGFDFVIPGNWSAGCTRNTSDSICGSIGAQSGYSMQAVDNSTWEDDSYLTLAAADKESCGLACFGDCNCEAALFSGGQCSKQRLPLRYGRRQVTDPTSALIKVGPANPVLLGLDPPGGNGTEVRKDVLIVGASLAGFGFVIAVISSFVIYRGKVWAYRKICHKIDLELGDDVAPRSFSYAQLEIITNNFREQIGRGSFGTVYKGVTPNGERTVAVKRLDRFLSEGEKEFQTEIEVIGKTHHRNLVRLLGYCSEGSKRLLVYEYMSSGSLADVLFGSEEKPSWEERMEIAREIARGVVYLHEDCDKQIIHCDLKPHNILMDGNRAKISDFGLAKLLNQDQTKTFTMIRGTRGYVAPEWHRQQPVTVKADVYSFGVMLLEIVCGRRNVDWEMSAKEAVLQDWAAECCLNGKVQEIVKLDEKVDREQFGNAVKVGLWCILDEQALRPTMKKVLWMLEGNAEVPLPPLHTLFGGVDSITTSSRTTRQDSMDL